MIILLSKLIFAQPLEYTYLEIGQPAPFSGRLFNDAASELLSETIDDNLAKCVLQTEYEIKKLQIEHNKELHDLKNDYNMVILQKNAKIEKLNKDIEILTEITYRHDFTDCYYTEEDKPKKADVQQIAKNLENQGVVGLNILVEIADRNDKIGEAFRCAIWEDMSIDEIATIAGIDY